MSDYYVTARCHACGQAIRALSRDLTVGYYTSLGNHIKVDQDTFIGAAIPHTFCSALCKASGCGDIIKGLGCQKTA